ncbi:MAG: FAD-dependent oxidoreductase [Chloroflexota bacterium]|nr:FAD-dependent oxidoreductase [Chloroflexota bacterium]
MGRSLFSGLDLLDAASKRLAEAQRDVPSEYMRFDLATYIPPKIATLPVRVAVVGGGFAGLAAATVLQNLQVQVTLFEAQLHLGGRVSSLAVRPSSSSSSSSTSGPPRILEAGAELIGRNHHAWVRLAKDLGLGLSVISTDDLYEGMALDPRLRIGGKDLSKAELEKLNKEMEKVLAKLVLLAETVFGLNIRPPSTKAFEPWYEPWRIPKIEKYDKQSLGSWINDRTSSNPRSKTRAALRYGFSNDMAIDVDRLSLLSMLTHIAGGGFGRYWDDTEVYRCENGNQSLATTLGERLRVGCPPADIRMQEVVTAIKSTAAEVVVTSRKDSPGAPSRDSKFNYLILAVPPTVWRQIDLGNTWQLPQPIQSGPAIKYLAFNIDSRYWVEQGMAPSGDDDQLGQLWESTDNQMGGANIGLTIFAGGQYAAQVPRQGVDRYFQNGIEKLLPGARRHVKAGISVDWPSVPYIKTGYAAPGLGEVTGLQRQMQQPFGSGDQIFLAGEHVSPPFFGFMEGALQSGIKAAERVARAARIQIPNPPKRSGPSTSGGKAPVRPSCGPASIA